MRKNYVRKTSREQLEAKVREALDWAIDSGATERDEERLAHIEALLRDALEHDHGVWRWRVGDEGGSDGNA